MDTDPTRMLSDEQIEQALDHALERGDNTLLRDIIHELDRRGQPVEV